MFVLGDERALGTFEQLFRLDMQIALMLPIVLFVHANKRALLAFEHLASGSMCTCRVVVAAAAAAAAIRCQKVHRCLTQHHIYILLCLFRIASLICQC